MFLLISTVTQWWSGGGLVVAQQWSDRGSMVVRQKPSSGLMVARWSDGGHGLDLIYGCTCGCEYGYLKYS
jgi:hypothetical protein